MVRLASEKMWGAGSNGVYFKHGKVGIKVGATDLATRREGRMLRLLNRFFPSRWPQFYGFSHVVVDGIKCLAIVMEHIKGRSLDSYTSAEFNRYEIQQELFEGGLFWEDCHPANIIRDAARKSWRCIDADPEYFEKRLNFGAKVKRVYSSLRGKSNGTAN